MTPATAQAAPLLSSPCGPGRRLANDFERAHHVVPLVFEDVAMPDVLRVGDAEWELDGALVRQLEPGSDSRDLPGVGLNRVLRFQVPNARGMEPS
jgi:hypothetical protein